MLCHALYIVPVQASRLAQACFTYMHGDCIGSQPLGLFLQVQHRIMDRDA